MPFLLIKNDSKLNSVNININKNKKSLFIQSLKQLTILGDLDSMV